MEKKVLKFNNKIFDSKFLTEEDKSIIKTIEHIDHDSEYSELRFIDCIFEFNHIDVWMFGIFASRKVTYRDCQFYNIVRLSRAIRANFEGICRFDKSNFSHNEFADNAFENITKGYFTNCDLVKSSFHGTLKNVEFSSCNLAEVKLIEEEKIRKGIILKEPRIGYKKCKFKSIVADDALPESITEAIVKLEIPKGAIVFSINNNKRRTNKAKCLSITSMDGIELKEAASIRDKSFKYEVGKEYEIEDFDLDYSVECASGIHFFDTEEQAKDYERSICLQFNRAYRRDH